MYLKKKANTEKESFREYLRSATNIITRNVYSDVFNIYKLLSNLTNNKNIVILAAEKETCTVIINRVDYQNKVNNRLMKVSLKGNMLKLLTILTKT